jgi:hypothetical protein
LKFVPHTNSGPQIFKNHKTIFSIVDEPPSWSDADDSLESMSDPEEKEDSDVAFGAGECAVNGI